MKKKEISIYGQALLDLCKKASVKYPLSLIDKKISVSFIDEEGVEIIVFSKISRISLCDTEDDGLCIYFLPGNNLLGGLMGLKYWQNNQWKYVCYKNGKQQAAHSVKRITFAINRYDFFKRILMVLSPVLPSNI